MILEIKVNLVQNPFDITSYLKFVIFFVKFRFLIRQFKQNLDLIDLVGFKICACSRVSL